MIQLRTMLTASAAVSLAAISIACSDPGGGGSGGSGGTGASAGSGGTTSGTGASAGSGASGGSGGTGASGGDTTGTGGSAATGDTGGSGGSGAGGSGGSGGAASGDAEVILLAGGPDGLLGGELVVGGTWTASAIEGHTTSEVAITPVGGAGGSLWATGLFRDSVSGLPYSTTWTNSGFSTPVPIGNQKILGGPSILALGNHFAAFQLEDFTYATSYKTGPMAPWASIEPVVSFDPNGSPVESHGPNPPTTGLLEGETALAFGGDDGDLYHQTPTGLTWTPPEPHGVPGTADGRPCIAEGLLWTMVLWNRKSDGQVHWTTYITFQDWPAPQAIPGVFTKDTPAFAYLMNSVFTLAFRGLDGNLYISEFDGSTKVWGAPQLMFGGVAIAGAPSIDSGIQSTVNDGELAFITADTGQVFHSSLVGGTWTEPVLVGGTGMTSVAIQAAFW